MKTLALAAAAAAVLLGTGAASAAGSCEEWICGMNGTQPTRIARPALEVNGLSSTP